HVDRLGVYVAVQRSRCDRESQGTSVRESRPWVAGEATVDDRREFRRGPGGNAQERRRIVRQPSKEDFVRASTKERSAPREHREADRAQRVEIAPPVDFASS